MELNIIELSLRFSDETPARELLESIRWPDSAVCPHCDGTNVSQLEPKPDAKKPGCKGVWECGECRTQFTVTVNSIFEGSHVELHKWVIAIYIICASKEGVSALQLQRLLSPLSYKNAWDMCHRIRHAMRRSTNKPISLHPLGPEEVLADLLQVKATK